MLATVTVLGLGWEFVYHFLMQFRWEKDWPSMFGLLTAVPEGLLVWLLLRLGVVPGLPDGVPTLTYGASLDNGPIRCTALHTGVKCVVRKTGKGFLISPTAIKRVSS